MVNMNGINPYQAYTAPTSSQPKTNRASVIANSKTETKKTDKATSRLSKGAQAMLNKIKQKYTQMDVFVTDFENGDDPAKHMPHSSKEYSLYIAPEELEKMAADEAYEKQNMRIIDDALATSDQVKEKYGLDAALKEDGNSTVVTKFGITLNSDGSTTFFVQLEELTQQQKERIEAIREKRAEEKKSDKHAKEQGIKDYDPLSMGYKKSTTLQAASLEELMKKIESVDWSKIREEEASTSGNLFDSRV